MPQPTLDPGSGGGNAPGSGGDRRLPDSPTEPLGFEVKAPRGAWSFTPEFYPKSFRQVKARELKRYGEQCSGESISIKKVKNRTFHVKGQLIEGNIRTFHKLLDHEGPMILLSPLTPSGGMECIMKQGELGDLKGWDPIAEQWMFKYTLDLVSTGRDEYQRNSNAIVSELTEADRPDGGGSSGGGGQMTLANE